MKILNPVFKLDLIFMYVMILPNLKSLTSFKSPKNLRPPVSSCLSITTTMSSNGIEAPKSIQNLPKMYFKAIFHPLVISTPVYVFT